MSVRIVSAPQPGQTPLLDRQDLARLAVALTALLLATALGFVGGAAWVVL